MSATYIRCHEHGRTWGRVQLTHPTRRFAVLSTLSSGRQRTVFRTEQVDFDTPGNEMASSSEDEPVSERSLAGVAHGLGLGPRARTSWAKNLPELLIGAVILSAGAALAWLSWRPADPAPHGTATHQSAQAEPTREPVTEPRLLPASRRRAPITVGDIPWADESPTASAACRVMTPRNMNRSIQRRARSEKVGHDMLLRGELGLARTAFCDATRYDTPTRLALTGLVRTQLQLGDPEAALSSVERLVSLYPEHTEAHQLLGDVLIRLGHAEDALEAWTSASGAPRLTSAGRADLRRASLKEADAAIAAAAYPRAERMLRRAIALDPEDVDSITELVSVLHEAGKSEVAERWLAYAEQLDRQTSVR